MSDLITISREALKEEFVGCCLSMGWLQKDSDEAADEWIDELVAAAPKQPSELEVFRAALDRLCPAYDDADLAGRLCGPRFTEEPELEDGPCGDDFGGCDNHLAYWNPGGESHVILHFRDGMMVGLEGWGE